jgi:alpha-L-fucosidase
MTRTIMSCAVLVAICLCCLAGQSSAADQVGKSMDVPYLAPPERVQWWEDMKFGMFIHWGAWSQTHRGRIWDMTDLESQAEGEKFLELYRTFNPVNFNPKEWARLAKEAGMKYVVFVTKHHDGFSNWDTAMTPLRVTNPDCPYSASENPDIVRRIVDAYRAEGIAIGLYYSHIDWFHPDAKRYSRSNWEYDPELVDKDPDSWRRYVEFECAQVAELLNNYGKIDICWFDISWPFGGNGQKITHPVVRKDAFDLVKMIRETNPDIIINNRGVDIHGDFFTPEQRVPEQGLPGHWEANLTISNGGGYWYRGPDSEYKTTEELVRMLVDIASKGGNFLMNVGPRPDGTLTPQEIDRLEGVGAWMKSNSDSIYGTTKTVFRDLGWGRCTVKGSNLYLHVFDWPKDGILKMRGLKNKALAAYFLAEEMTEPLLSMTQEKDDVFIRVGKKPLDPIDTVVVLAVDGVPNADRSIQAGFDDVIVLRSDEAAIEGETAVFVYGHGTQRGDFIGEWTSASDSASWKFKVRDAGKYAVSIVYAAEEPGKKSPFKIRVGDQTLSGVTAFTAKPYTIKGSGIQRTFEDRPAGEVTFASSGMNTLSVKADKIDGKEFIKLKTVRLTHIDGQ